jgi:hypothetical protein
VRLFDLLTEHAALIDLLLERDGELGDDETAAVVDSWFADIAAEEGRKLDSIIGVIRTLEAEAAAANAEMSRWMTREIVRRNAIKRIKDRVKLYLEMTGRKKVTTADGRPISICGNGGLSPLWLEPEPVWERIGPDHKKVTMSFDNDGIRASLARGEDLPFARLEPRQNHLRIG